MNLRRGALALAALAMVTACGAPAPGLVREFHASSADDDLTVEVRDGSALVAGVEVLTRAQVRLARGEGFQLANPPGALDVLLVLWDASECDDAVTISIEGTPGTSTLMLHLPQIDTCEAMLVKYGVALRLDRAIPAASVRTTGPIRPSP